MAKLRKLQVRFARTSRVRTSPPWPYPVAISPDGKRIYVANRDSDTVSVIDAATEKVVAFFRAGVAQSELLVSPGSSRP
jgi:YVTN family beta-propeller protein